ncbi:MAG: DUF6163 family protein [Pseudochelatococcus sp.]|uniref:DUF6163 family protein n=1 Tax=Pseudochelatococcus sp. TaxID=2020869 RepID=UPI003D936DAA
MTIDSSVVTASEPAAPGDSPGGIRQQRAVPAREFPRGGALHLDGPKKPFRWDIALVWFMRVIAVVWIAKGLAYWVILLGFLPQAPVFEAQTLQWQSAIVYFAVIDLVAAVGLWLASAWGGVIWLLSAMSYILTGIFWPHAVVSGPAVPGVLGLLVVAYFILSWFASRIEP